MPAWTLDEQGASIVKLVYPNNHEALRARALVQDAISKVIRISAPRLQERTPTLKR